MLLGKTIRPLESSLRSIIRPFTKRLLWWQLSKQFPNLRRKEIIELAFQKVRSDQFRKTSVQAKWLEYWKLYRYLGDIEAEISLGNCKIVDVGCGVSTVLHFIPGEKYGIDPLADYYKTFYQYPPDVAVSKGYGEEIPFQDNFCDVVFCSNVIDHVDDPKKTISEIYRILRPRGHLVLTVECFDKPYKRDAAHPWSLTYTEVEMLLREFRVKFRKSSPYIALGPYILLIIDRFVRGGGVSIAKNKEFIYLCESTKTGTGTGS